MPKERLNCWDCAFFERGIGDLALCWKRDTGPAILHRNEWGGGLCGEEIIREPHHPSPRHVWLAVYDHPRDYLEQVMLLLKLACAQSLQVGDGSTLAEEGSSGC